MNARNWLLIVGLIAIVFGAPHVGAVMEYATNWINLKPENPSAIVPGEGRMFWNSSSQQVNVYDANLDLMGLDGRLMCDYLVYTNGTHYFAKNCSSGIEKSGTDAYTIIQYSVDKVSEKGGGIVFIKAGDYVLSSPVSICAKNNTKIIGSGIDKTIIKNAGFVQNCVIDTRNVYIGYMTINVNNNSYNAINMVRSCWDCIIDNVKVLNTSDKFLIHGNFCGGLIKDVTAIDAGLTVGVDNVVVNNLENCSQLVIDNLYSLKEFSVGGGLFTNGGTYNTLFENSMFVDKSGNVYAGISIEHQSMNSSNVIIANNYVEKGIMLGVNPNSGENILITDNIVKYGCITVYADDTGALTKRRVSITDNICVNSTYGIMLTSIYDFVVANNIIINTNIQNSSFTLDKGGVYLKYAKDGTISGNVIRKENCDYCNPFGIRFIYTDNTTSVNNQIEATDKYLFWSPTNYYIDDYTYSSLPTCTDIFDGRTITYYNSTGVTYYRYTCINGTWYGVALS